MNKEQEDLLYEIYYVRGYKYGRDKIFNKIKHLPYHPSRRQVQHWLDNQK